MKKPSLKIPNSAAIAFLGLVVLFTITNGTPPEGTNNPISGSRQPNSNGQSFNNSPTSRGRSLASNSSPTFWSKFVPQSIQNSKDKERIVVIPGDPITEAENRSIARQEMIEEFKHLARYPNDSTPIWGDNDTMAAEYAPSKNTVGPPDKNAPPIRMTVWTSKAFYQFPDVPIIYGQLTDTKGQNIPGKIEAILMKDDGQEIGRIQLNDVGSGKDAIAGDGTYTGSPDFNASQEATLAGNYTVIMRGYEFADRYEIRTTTGFLWSSPGGYLTGRYRDSSDGNFLTIEAEMKITTPGRFHIQGTLYSVGGKALAWAQNATEYKPGTYWIALKYYGLIFRELNADGPYSLKNVALSRTGIDPNMKGPLIESAHKTSAYSAAQFTNKPYGNPNYLDQIAQLEQDEQDEKGQGQPHN